LIGFALLLLLLAGSVPVGYVMAAVGMIGFAIVVSPQAAFSMATIDLYTTFSDYKLTTIPLFVLMGQIAFHTGISRGLFNAAYHWMGRLPGGLAMSTVGACTAFGAICGSGPATSATIASVALPEMRRYKYDIIWFGVMIVVVTMMGVITPPVGVCVYVVAGMAAAAWARRSLGAWPKRSCARPNAPCSSCLWTMPGNATEPQKSGSATDGAGQGYFSR
jgi:TRAP-type mannitol/chloroaromatic compound transport system permease large subunit